jgi:hypothetical protein
MISRYENGGGWQKFANQLIAILKSNQTIQHMLEQATDAAIWANESFVYTQQVCYNFMYVSSTNSSIFDSQRAPLSLSLSSLTH